MSLIKTKIQKVVSAKDLSKGFDLPNFANQHLKFASVKAFLLTIVKKIRHIPNRYTAPEGRRVEGKWSEGKGREGLFDYDSNSDDYMVCAVFLLCNYFILYCVYLLLIKSFFSFDQYHILIFAKSIIRCRKQSSLISPE